MITMQILSYEDPGSRSRRTAILVRRERSSSSPPGDNAATASSRLLRGGNLGELHPRRREAVFEPAGGDPAGPSAGDRAGLPVAGAARTARAPDASRRGAATLHAATDGPPRRRLQRGARSG